MGKMAKKKIMVVDRIKVRNFLISISLGANIESALNFSGMSKSEFRRLMTTESFRMQVKKVRMESERRRLKLIADLAKSWKVQSYV